MSSVKRLALAIVQFLAEQKQYGNLSPDAQESLEVAVQCLETAFELTPEDATSLSVSKSLLDIFHDAVASEIPTFPAEVPEDIKLQAEKLKNEGNNLMKSEQFTEALVCYSKAIELDGRNAVYFCNRAAAHSKLNQHQSAIDDCKKAITIDPLYSKAYGRMGLAHASLNQHGDAVRCYERAVQLEPENESYQSNLQIAEEKLKQTGGAERLPGMGPGMGIPGLDVGAMLNNPGLMSMAQQMLSNPNMQQLMNQMMTGSAQGGGGLESLLQVGQQLAHQMQATNPELVEQLRRQMGGPGGGPNPFDPSSEPEAKDPQ
ncbi:small glutamine-rich tetratricopeptide repeat-containing protein beta-like [Daphnia pulex]|uniref:small glutamine-rich tetratricopeptide repeat-containing protein beta-like n=1 Tax=Daphnia pulex TaxID=6669 RepID=UPI001EE098EC|nr:small glutamine-rich tetratricopeptide repeat-containing protein beta-like [Daphnia pulex]XP_046438467.1 small glutamine-rich tetratricopeptide repeat-containing protein beta-like [Daphnia pulex]